METIFYPVAALLLVSAIIVLGDAGWKSMEQTVSRVTQAAMAA